MNVEELRKLKAKVEEDNKKKRNNCYVTLLDYVADDQADIFKERSSMSFDDIQKVDKTEEVIQEIGALLEDTVLSLSESGISYDKIVLTSQMGFLLDADYFESLRKIYLKNGVVLEDKDIDADEFLHNISTRYVPICFWVDIESMQKECSFDEVSTYQALPVDEVRGIVNIDLFLRRMDDLGYELSVFGEECSSSRDYRKFIYENGYFDGWLDLTVNLAK